MQRTKIAIVGGGAAGLSTAWALACAGEREVVLLEREPALGTVSSRLNAAILRTLTPDPAVSAFARESAGFLRAPPPDFCSQPLLEPTGLLLAAEGEAAVELERQATECADGRGFERLDERRARALAPHFASPPGVRLWFADEGRLDNAALLLAFARAARAAGARLHCRAAVQQALRTPRGFELVLAGGARLECAALVLASGAWTEVLARELGSRVELQTTRRHLLVTRGATGVPPRAPIVWTGSDPFYARRDGDGLLLSPCDEQPIAPDRNSADPALRGELQRKASRFLPGVALGIPAHYWSGLRAFSGDGERFCIGPDPDVRGLHWAAGLAGHGMTCSIAVGRLAAACLLDRADGVHAPTGAFARAFAPARLVRHQPVQT
ncbi:MAG: FAD-binding oxidoreductase [Planctomycetes bacterium]|nr:FAD-binding oxidoreductase [Planctomycetota bacterium]